MPIGQCNNIPRVDAQGFRDGRQLVGEGDVHIAVGVLAELDQLRGPGVGQVTRSLDHQTEQVGGALGRWRRDAADNAVVVDKFDQYAARQHALRTVGDEHVG